MGRFAVGLLVGVTVGVTVATLCAPRSGRETRQKLGLSGPANRQEGQPTSRVDEVIGRANALFDRVRQRFGSARSAAQQASVECREQLLREWEQVRAAAGSPR